MPIGAVDHDGVETLIAETFESPRDDALGDAGGKQRTLGISLVQIVDDVARIDDGDFAIEQHRNLQPRIGIPQSLAHVPRQCIDMLEGKTLEIERHGDLAGEGADLASVERDGHDAGLSLADPVRGIRLLQ
jgi:hypothetical protein